MFPLRVRSSILGAFFLAGILGSVLGVVLGGIIAERWGWQMGFGAVGIPGILLAFVFLLIVRDYKTVALPTTEAGNGSPARVASRAIVIALLKPRTALIACLGAGFQLLTLSMTYAWLPTYFNRYYGLAPDQAGLKAGLVVLVGGIGAFVWGVVADRLTPRVACARLYVPAVGAVLTMVLMATAFGALPPGNAQYALIVLGRSDDGGQRRPGHCRRDRRRASERACHGRIGPLARAEHVRARRRSSAHRHSVRQVRAAIRACRGSRLQPARGGVLPARCAHLRLRSSTSQERQAAPGRRA
jgi:MFS family permease